MYNTWTPAFAFLYLGDSNRVQNDIPGMKLQLGSKTMGTQASPTATNI